MCLTTGQKFIILNAQTRGKIDYYIFTAKFSETPSTEYWWREFTIEK